jgi:hypothetical protein
VGRSTHKENNTMNSDQPTLDPSELIKWLTALRRAVNTPR